MSTPSKKRRKAREWMQKEAAKRADDHREYNRLVNAAIRAERDRLTRMIYTDKYDDVVYPQGNIDHPYLKIMDNMNPTPGFLANNMAAIAMSRPPIYVLEAEQHALLLPNGTKVVWYGWRMR
jgi:hypothetical protein